MEDQVLISVIGIMVVSGGGVAAHLYSVQGKLRDRVDASRDKIEAAMAEHLKTLWASVHDLSKGITEDRREASLGRERMATKIGELVTREDLRTEMVRVVSEIDRRATHRQSLGDKHD